MATYGIDKRSTTATYNSVWRSQLFPIGEKFKIIEVRIPFAGAVAANVTITPKIYFDDGSTSITLQTINNSNMSGARKVVFKQAEIVAAGGNTGQNNFFLEFTWTGSANLPVALPIKILVDIQEDEPRTF